MTVFIAVQCESGAGNHYIESVPNGRVDVRCEHHQIVSQLSYQNFRVSLWNAGTMRGRSNEVIELMSIHKVDICSFQEVRWRVASASLVEGKESRYKMFLVGNDKAILLAQKWVEAMFDVKCVLYINMLIKLVVGKRFILHKLILMIGVKNVS